MSQDFDPFLTAVLRNSNGKTHVKALGKLYSCTYMHTLHVRYTAAHTSEGFLESLQPLSLHG